MSRTAACARCHPMAESASRTARGRLDRAGAASLDDDVSGACARARPAASDLRDGSSIRPLALAAAVWPARAYGSRLSPHAESLYQAANQAPGAVMAPLWSNALPTSG